MGQNSKFITSRKTSLQELSLWKAYHYAVKPNWQHFRNFANTISEVSLWKYVLYYLISYFIRFCLVLWEFCMCLNHPSRFTFLHNQPTFCLFFFFLALIKSSLCNFICSWMHGLARDAVNLAGATLLKKKKKTLFLSQQLSLANRSLTMGRTSCPTPFSMLGFSHRSSWEFLHILCGIITIVSLYVHPP